MVSTLHPSARALLLTALVGGSALLVPPAAGAQSVTPEQALLNKVEVAPRGAVTAFTQVQAAQALADQGLVNGERALLNQNRSRTVGNQQMAQPETAQPGLVNAPYADGVRALLNRSSL